MSGRYSHPCLTGVAFDDGEMVVPHIGGDFSTANVPVFYVAKYRFTQWLDLDDGLFDRVRALATFDDGDGEGLYAGGDFTRTQADNTPANRIARWNRVNWRPLGSGLVGGEVRALAGFGSGLQRSLYAGGWFQTAGGQTSRYMARWSCPDDAVIFRNGFEIAGRFGARESVCGCILWRQMPGMMQSTMPLCARTTAVKPSGIS